MHCFAWIGKESMFALLKQTAFWSDRDENISGRFSVKLITTITLRPFFISQHGIQSGWLMRKKWASLFINTVNIIFWGYFQCQDSQIFFLNWVKSPCNSSHNKNSLRSWLVDSRPRLINKLKFICIPEKSDESLG